MECLKFWVSNCINTHSQCLRESSGESALPTRVLDLGSNPEKGPIRLTETNGQLKGRYIALSYAWGGAEFIKTKIDTYERYQKQGIALDELPPTFQDVIELCHTLEIRYLWIDSLCIIQDDRNDWKHESVRMADVYQNAFLTVSALFNTSPYGGLFSDAQVRCVGPVATQETRHPYWTALEKNETIALGFPLLTRGWTFQERMLSPRVLHFTKHEMIWDCREATYCQCGGRYQNANTKLRRNSQTRYEFSHVVLNKSDLSWNDAFDTWDFSQLWKDIVTEYSETDFTVKSDRTVAISGIATLIQRATKWNYLAGLWKETLVGDLCWFATSFPDPPQETRRKPTWSWFSVDGSFSWISASHDEPGLELIRILSCGSTLSTPSPTGPVHDAFLEVEGYLAFVSNNSSELGGVLAQFWDCKAVWFDEGEAALNKYQGPFYLLPLLSTYSWTKHGLDKGFYCMRLLIVTPATNGSQDMIRIGMAFVERDDFFVEKDEIQLREQGQSLAKFATKGNKVRARLV
jgi:Heterokaryon incompatibility protein (HET).